VTSFGIINVESIGSATTVLGRFQTNSHTYRERNKTAIFDTTLELKLTKMYG
jgi:hypothetical protein